MAQWLLLVFFTVVGACVGSFVNVVILRVPEGQSVVHPPSRCPRCQHRLAWYDNVPILGWLWLRGKCRYCKTPISIQYPLIELFTAVAFGGLYGIYYLTDLRPTFSVPGVAETWPAFVVHLVLVAALIAATVIDARFFIIPLPIPWVVTAVALVVLPGSVALGWMTNRSFSLPTFPPTPLPPPVPVASVAGLTAAIGGTVGLALALVLLRLGVLPRSFDDFDDTADPEADADVAPMTVQEEILSYPHPRREVLKEALFVALPLIGTLAGLAAGLRGPLAELAPPESVRVLGGVLGGYLVGAGVVWFTRIGGTLMFGKEAMGLGDVHLMAAVGAILGGCEATRSFFIAPFLGLAAVAIVVGIAAVGRGRVRVIPYGPYLAAAAVVVLIFRAPIQVWLPIC